jgi:nitrogen fixation protein NifX
MKISFASTDSVHVNQHFGWCEKFYMYELDKEGYTFVKELDSSLKLDDEVDKLEYKISCLEQSDIVCVVQIGPKASSMVQKSGIYPMSSKEESIEVVLQKLQNMIQENPPLWLKRILLK